MAFRIDAHGTFAKPSKTPQGFLRCDATPTRCGVFTYRLGDGSIRKELRHPDEVFKADSLASLQNAPLTDDHPTETITADNAQQFSRGYVCDAPSVEGEHVRTAVLITDSALIKRAQKGKRELSCGYHCDLDVTPGEYNGERYDAVQRNISYNHVALVSAGRAGPSARLHLDAADAVIVKEDSQSMFKITIDGVEHEVATEACAQAFAKFADAQKAELSKLQARADSAEAEAQKAQAALQVASDPKRIDSAVSERLELVKQAEKAGVKCDGLSAIEIKRAVVAKLSPSLVLDGKDDVYVSTAFDVAVVTAPAKQQDEPVVITQDATSASEKIAAHRKQIENAWRESLTAKGTK
jgi:uncharacterized protein